MCNNQHDEFKNLKSKKYINRKRTKILSFVKMAATIFVLSFLLACATAGK